MKNSENSNPKFEIVLQIRDANGLPTGKTRSFSSDNSDEIETFFQRNNMAKNKHEKYKTHTK